MKRTVMILFVIGLLVTLRPAHVLADSPVYLVKFNALGVIIGYRIYFPEMDSSLDVPPELLVNISDYENNPNAIPPCGTTVGPNTGYQKLTEGDPAIKLLNRVIDLAQKRKIVIFTLPTSFWLSVDKEGRQWVAVVEPGNTDIISYDVEGCQQEVEYKAPGWPLNQLRKRTPWPPADEDWREISRTDWRVMRVLTARNLDKQAEEKQESKNLHRSFICWFCFDLCH